MVASHCGATRVPHQRNVKNSRFHVGLSCDTRTKEGTSQLVAPRGLSDGGGRGNRALLDRRGTRCALATQNWRQITVHLCDSGTHQRCMRWQPRGPSDCAPHRAQPTAVDKPGRDHRSVNNETISYAHLNIGSRVAMSPELATSREPADILRGVDSHADLARQIPSIRPFVRTNRSARRCPCAPTMGWFSTHMSGQQRCSGLSSFG